MKVDIDGISFAGYQLTLVEDFSILSGFDCGDVDLNEFFCKDSENYHRELFAKVYSLSPADKPKEIIALISYHNDSIKLKEEQKQDLPDDKRRYKEYPAVKIGRLAVKKELQGNQIGTLLISLTIRFFLTRNRTGCRYLTVDAYNNEKVLRFYSKNGFEFLTHKDSKKHSRTMYLDLKHFEDDIVYLE